MGVIKRIKKPVTHKGKKILLSKEPKLIENPKQTLFVHGRKISERVLAVMKDMYDLKKPQVKNLTRKNDIVPFENSVPLEILLKKHDSSLFFFGSNNKKRPHNLIIGRTFDESLLDMFEFGVDEFKGLADFKVPKITVGTKPCIVFSGDWEKTPETKRLCSLFTDLFQRENASSIRLQGLEHVLSLTLVDDTKILIRSYKIILKKSGQKTPRIELDEIGPSIDLSMRRNQLASENLFKEACRVPKQLKIRVKKNISRDKLGTVRGRIHIGKQMINKLQTRKMKGLRKASKKKTK